MWVPVETACPHCGEYLDTDHRCRGLWRLRLRVWGFVALGGVAGAAAATIVLLALYDAVSAVAIFIGALLGAAVVFAYLRGEP